MTTVIFVAMGRGDRDQGYAARFPDLPGATASGADMAELIGQAREAVRQELSRLADAGQEWPEATPLEQLVAEPGETPFVVDVAVEDAPLRVNISIGERLLKRIDQAAEAKGMSRSAFIAAACRASLGDVASRKAGADFEAASRKLQDELAALGRRINDSLGPDSAFHRTVSDLDDRLTETIRKAADNVSAAMARRQQAEAKPEPAEPQPH
jgi:predicted RNase H-like HicB family nuclease